jgi:hypothetical protein
MQCDDVESDPEMAPLRVAQQLGLRAAQNSALFSRSPGGERSAERRAASLADLDDDQRVCGQADEVDFSCFAAEIFHEHDKLALFKVARGQGLSRHALLLSPRRCHEPEA